MLSNAFAGATTAAITNNFGIDPDYHLGYVHMWNLDVQRDFRRTFQIGIGYTGTKGTALDIQRAPNRGPGGLRIAGVQPFIWESSEGESIMHSMNLSFRKRLTRGFAAGARYTLSKSIDNASSIGGGGAVVAQNDQDIDAERGLSSFDQRHRLTADVNVELPFGRNRRWLDNDGLAATLLGGWMWNANMSIASGTPFTARVLGDSREVLRGTNGTLRANYTGAPIEVADPSVQMFFNTAAFTIPAPGTFGNAGRNTITGPGSKNVNMSLMKTINVAGTRGIALRVQANNVLNTPQYAAIDTVVNSPTFGQVVSMRPMRSVQVVARLMF